MVTLFGIILMIIGLGLGLKGGFEGVVNLQMLALSVGLVGAGVGFMLLGALWDILEAVTANNKRIAQQVVTSNKQAGLVSPRSMFSIARAEGGEFVEPIEQGQTEWEYNGKTITQRGKDFYISGEPQSYATLLGARANIDSHQTKGR